MKHIVVYGRPVIVCVNNSETSIRADRGPLAGWKMIEALGVAVVKNEADVIEAFIRHNLTFMDALFIADNDSVDGTREIIVQLIQQGLPIVLFDDPITGHFQAEKVTAMYRRIIPNFQPRFVFLLDADEFIVAPSREILYSQLHEMRPGTQAQYYWQTYIPEPTASGADISDPLRSITHRRVSDPPWAKSIIITDPKIDTRLHIQQGGHNVTLGRRSLQVVKLKDVVLGHFPVRSVDQATSKALVGWITNMERNRTRGKSGFGFQKKLLYERIVSGPGLTSEYVTHEALKYAQPADYVPRWPDDVISDPVTAGYAGLTAQPRAACTPLQKVARCVDKIMNPEAKIAQDAQATGFLQAATRNQGFRERLARSWRSGATRDLYVDIPPFRYLAERHQPGSVLDIGCGSGAYLKYFASRGSERIHGLDRPGETFRYLERGEFSEAGLAEPGEFSETFDLVICTEAIDGIPAHSQAAVIDNIVRHARHRIVFSAGRPGESNDPDAHLRPIAEWLELFKAAGWEPDLFESLAMRSLSTFPWFHGNLVVLAPGPETAGARQRLIELETRKPKRRDHRAAVITHPFAEAEEQISKGGIRKWAMAKIRS
ncbi:glycosyltransferase family 2 protein [Mycolicibacterium aichiense]|uniref:glycosyltransferase family 2 protein n=1 Tax=Mycolicibacterium aichiense TaxID=1799 RepID=UPI003D67CAA9